MDKNNLSRINEDPCIFGRRSHRMIRSQNNATAAAQRSALITHTIPTHLFPTVTCCLAETLKISPSDLLINIIIFFLQSVCADCRLMGCCSQSQAILSCPPSCLYGAWKVSWSALRFKRWLRVYIGLWLLQFGKLTMLDCWLMRTHITARSCTSTS